MATAELVITQLDGTVMRMSLAEVEVVFERTDETMEHRSGNGVVAQIILNRTVEVRLRGIVTPNGDGATFFPVHDVDPEPEEPKPRAERKRVIRRRQ